MELRYYWQLLRRRIPMIVILTTIGTALGLSLALTLPPIFNSRAVLIVESEQIPDELAASTVQTSEIEALQIIRQRILSREVLLELANRLDIYENLPDMSADRKVSDLRNRIELTTPEGQRVRRRGTTTEATIVTVGFQAPNAQLAADTANELVTLILQENVDMRTAVARQTLDFFEQEVERLEQDLSTVSGQILNFQEENLESLPDSLEFRRSQQATLQQRIAQLEREQVALQDRRAQLVILFETTGRTEFNSNRRTSGSQRAALRPEEIELNDLRAEYARLSATLSESNPRMVVLRSQIDAAETAVENLPPPETTQSDAEDEVRSVEMSLFDIQLADIDAQISYIEEQKAVVNSQLARLSETIAATPGNAVTLSSLERSYQNLQTQYNQAVANRARAETGSIIESLSRGQRITAVEQAVAPERPTSPNRPLISVAGMLGGLMIGLVIFVLLELFNRSVRRPQDLQKALGIDTFGTVPYMTTDWEHFQRRTLTLTASAVLLIGITGGLWYVDRNVRPLQPIVENVLDRMNLGQLL